MPAPRPVGRPVPGRARRLRVRAVVRVAAGRRRPAAQAAQGPGARDPRRPGPDPGGSRNRAQARLPRGRVPETLAAMVRTWGELDQLEKDNDLSFLRQPDLGFAWAAYRWARGTRLETVLDEAPDLTPGDFVRSVKQLIDLLDQIASAIPADPPDPPDPQDDPSTSPTLATTARAAIDAMRRGVIAYSAVAD